MSAGDGRGRRRWIRPVTMLALVACVALLYRWGLWQGHEDLRRMEAGWEAAVVIVLLMASAWAFALPASAFLFIAPLLFPPAVSAAVTTTGSVAGAAAGYSVARFAGGWWVERFRDGRLRRLFARHSSLAALVGVRLSPGSPHGFINYAAGLASVPLPRFLLATAAAMALKSYVYAEAVRQTAGAESLADALGAKTMLSLLALALLTLGGHLLGLRLRRDEASKATPA